MFLLFFYVLKSKIYIFLLKLPLFTFEYVYDDNACDIKWIEIDVRVQTLIVSTVYPFLFSF